MHRTLESLFGSKNYPLCVDNGRDIDAGHMRGWGLEYGALAHAHVDNDPLYAAARQAARDRGSLLSDHKLANLYLIIRFAMDEASDIFEFGSFSGGSAVFMGTLLKLLGRSGKVYAFDTFDGMPDTNPLRDLHSKGDFADTGLPGLLDYIQLQGLQPFVRTVEGRFDATLPSVLNDMGPGRVGLMHVDCDLYEPIKYVVTTCLPALRPSSHIVFDDPLHGSCLGAFDAVQELLIRDLSLTAEQAYPHLVFRYPPLQP